MIGTVLRSLGLLIPALVPSWRFFDTVAPSPRIQIVQLASPDAVVEEQDWQTFRPRPKNLPLWQMILRIFWNYRWNESLYLMSCAERLMRAPSAHSDVEIIRHIQRDLLVASKEESRPLFARYSLLFITREEGELYQVRAYMSELFPVRVEEPHHDV